MLYTDNLNLKKPEENEFYDVNDFNSNVDIIDAAIKALQDGKADAEDYLKLTGGTITGDLKVTGDLLVKAKRVITSLNGLTAAADGSISITKTITSSADLNNLPAGEYFFAGSCPVGDSDSVLAGTDFNGISLYEKGQATQILFQGRKVFYRLDDGAVIGSVPSYGAWVEFITSNNMATTSEYGITKLADETAALAEATAAVPVPLMYEINDFRRMSKAYSLGDKVACAFEYKHFLECTKAGTTSSSTPLDTRNVKHGQVLTDGGVQWTVRTHIKSVNGIVAGADGDVVVPQISASEIVNIVYPVGSLYWSKNSTNPNMLFGGTWVQIKDKFILTAGDTYKVGTTGGEAAHALTIAELPAHNHTGTAANAALNGAIDTTDNNVDARRCGTGDGTGILSSREDGSVFRYGKDGFVSAPTGIKINATHSHTISINNTGNGVAHNNMPPYVTYYCWERTA